MNKYTLEQLKEMTNEQRDEVVALAQGWETVGGNPEAIIPTLPVYDIPNAIHVEDYHPSTNKEQAWDLMVKCLDSFLVKKALLQLTSYSDILTEAVVIASILALQESE